MSSKKRRPRRRGGRKPGLRSETLEDWNTAAKGCMRQHAADYLKHLEVVHYSAHTIETRRRNLSYFFQWCDDRSFEKPDELNRAAVEAYQRYVFRYRKPDDKPLAISTQFSRLHVVKSFLKHLAKRYVIEYNPAAELQMPRGSVRIPRQVFNVEEVETIMELPNLETPEGLRDRAILELFYSTGIRRMELANLSVYDLDFVRGVLLIREGKGRKDRVVPVADRAQRWARLYLDKARPQLHYQGDEITLFLSVSGEPLESNSISGLVRDYVNRAETGKKGACHLFRHTVATLMLENGADIRYIQQMLGHSSIESTQIYTQVSIRQLKTVHNLTHPTNVNGKAKLSKPPPEAMPPV